MEKTISAVKLVFKNPFYFIVGLSLSLNLLLIYYLIFFQTTTLSLLFSTTNSFYAGASVLLTILTSLAFGISLTFLMYKWKEMPSLKNASGGKNIIGSVIGAFSMGCPVCGSFLLPIIGIAGGLSFFPFQGLELKLAALLLFGLSIYELGKCIADKTCPAKEGIFKLDKGTMTLNLSRGTLINYVVPLAVLLIVIILPFLPADYKVNISKKAGSVSSLQPASSGSQAEGAELLEQINPPAGYETKAVLGDTGPQLVASGAIDLEKFKQVYEEAGQPLTQEQLDILTKGSSQKISITPQNSYFLLNFFWAFGLANKNKILDEGPMMQYGADQLGNFASTGGWTLGTKKATDLYSKYEIVKLDSEQQKVLEDFAFNSYRPCCSNPTGFPDCNHGMAALGFGELMAAQGATADEIFEAFKYLNAFWFPQTYFDVANYFKAKEGKDWSQVDVRTIAGKDYSTPQGSQRVRQWLVSNNLVQEPPSGGGGCGV